MDFQPNHKKRPSCTQPTQYPVFNQRFRLAQFLLSEQEDALELILENYALETAERYFDAGVEKGTCKEKITIARRMEKKNMPVEEIAEYTDLKIDEVKKILHV